MNPLRITRHNITLSAGRGKTRHGAGNVEMDSGVLIPRLSSKSSFQVNGFGGAELVRAKEIY